MNRTIALIALLLLMVGASGCLANGSIDSPEPTATSSTHSTTLANQSVEFPDKPGDLTVQNVQKYVESYEKAYRKQDIYDTYSSDSTAVRDVMVSTQNVSAEEHGDGGFLVTHQYMVGYTTETRGEATAHDTRYTAVYVVNESDTMRAATTGINGSELDPIENGTDVGQ